ncbi:MAG: hypothetical protein MZW92_66535 [Comamonadaceae bacterium]|nr:hypothetical protein [Comamonadaceae bacterium]
MGHQPRAAMEQLQAARQRRGRPQRAADRRRLELRRGRRRRALRAGLAAVAQRQRHRDLQRPRARRDPRRQRRSTAATRLIANQGYVNGLYYDRQRACGGGTHRART